MKLAPLLLISTWASMAVSFSLPAEEMPILPRGSSGPNTKGNWTAPPAADGLPPASLSGMGRSLWINNSNDFCLLMPPDPVHQDIVGALDDAVSYCIHPVNGTRPMPDGFLKTVHYSYGPHWKQVTGTYERRTMHFANSDCGSEYDSVAPKGVTLEDGNFFFQFLGGCDGSGQSIFCMRICDDYDYCSSAYDQLGCRYVAPGDYEEPQGFTDCSVEDDDPVMVYNHTSTFFQGMQPTPPPRAPPRSSDCHTFASPTPSGVTYSWNQYVATKSSSATTTYPAYPTASAAPSGGGSNSSSSNALSINSGPSNNNSKPLDAPSSSSSVAASQQSSNGSPTIDRLDNRFILAAVGLLSLVQGGTLLL